MVEPDTTVPIGTYGAVSLPSVEADSWDIFIDRIDDSKYPEVKVYVSVIDPGNDRPMMGISKDNFEIEINENPLNKENIKNVEQFTGEVSKPASISLVIDRSGSMQGENYDDQPLEDAKTGAKKFVELMSSKDRAEVISFGDNTTLEQSFTHNKQSLYSAINSLNSEGATALYDAIWLGIEDIAKETNQCKAVIVLTDGAENNSSSLHGGGNYDFNYGVWLEYPDNSLLIEKSQNYKIPIYTIGLQGFNFTRERVTREYTTTEKDLKEIAYSTGGEYFYAPKSAQLEGIYEDIKQRLEQQYIITFTDDTETTEGYLSVVLNYSQLYGYDTIEYSPPAQAIQNSKNRVEVYGTVNAVNKTLKVYKDLNSLNTPIGEKYWGSIGTIIDGPKEADGVNWYKIKWDNDENVLNSEYYKPESGWSESGYIWEYDQDERVRGVDVSHNNEISDWQAIYNSGRKFVFIKSNEGGIKSDGNCFIDEKFIINANGARVVGIYISFYHLARPDLNSNTEGASQEANCFSETINNYYSYYPYNHYLLPALDIEENYGMNWKDIAEWIHVWMEKVKEKSNFPKYPLLYCNQDTAYNLCQVDSSIRKYPLWIVDWSNKIYPPTYDWDKCSFRQYAGALDPEWAGRARCPGFVVNAGVDLDIFNGSLEDLKADFLIN
jgi:VWFA-related protein